MGPGGRFMPVAVEVKPHERAAIVAKVNTIRVEHGDWEIVKRTEAETAGGCGRWVWQGFGGRYQEGECDIYKEESEGLGEVRGWECNGEGDPARRGSTKERKGNKDGWKTRKLLQARSTVTLVLVRA